MEPQDPENPQAPKDAKPTAPTKRVRRRAPPYTLVWSEEVRTHPKITTRDVIELRTRALQLIRDAEARIQSNAGLARIVPVAFDNVVSKGTFKVGENWFLLELRRAKIREYVVKLATPPPPPAPGDEPKAGVAHAGDRQKANGAAQRRGKKKDGGGSNSALSWLSSFRTEITVRMQFTQRDLNRRLAELASQISPKLISLCDRVNEVYGSAWYKTRVLGAFLLRALRRCASTIATGRISFTRMRELPAQQVGLEARLEPRHLGHMTGLHVLLYSWISDEPPPVDWSADLFGSSIDWAANLFGVLPEEERATT